VEQLVGLGQVEFAPDAGVRAVAAGDHPRFVPLDAVGAADLDAYVVRVLLDADDGVVLAQVDARVAGRLGQHPVQTDAVDDVGDRFVLVEGVGLAVGAAEVEARAVHLVLEQLLASALGVYSQISVLTWPEQARGPPTVPCSKAGRRARPRWPGGRTGNRRGRSRRRRNRACANGRGDGPNTFSVGARVGRATR